MMKHLILFCLLLVASNCVMFEHLKKGTACPDLSLLEYQKKNMECLDENKTGHCLIDDQNNHGLVCENIVKIPKGISNGMYYNVGECINFHETN